jgi:hypothetical protein
LSLSIKLVCVIYLFCLGQSSVCDALSSKDITLRLPLVLRDVGLVHDELALPGRCKGQVPEIAIDEVLKAGGNERHFLVVLPVRPQSARTN